MWEHKSPKAKLPPFKRELAEGGGASVSASYIKQFHGKKNPSSNVVLKKMTKDELIMTLIDSGSSFNYGSESLTKQLGEPSKKKRTCIIKMKASKNEKLDVKESTKVPVLLQKIDIWNITVEFLATEIEQTIFY